MKIYSVLIWGLGNDYERIINQVRFEELKGNLSVKALIGKKGTYVGKRFDGMEIISSTDIKDFLFDFIVVATSKYFRQILSEAASLGIDEDKIINGMVFLRPLFDFRKYAKLLKNHITILSDDCWGGYFYNYLYMKFYSPLINIYWRKDSFIKFIYEPESYLSEPLQMEREANIRKNECAIGSLGKGDKKVFLELVHSVTFSDAKRLWDKRVKRINTDNFFIKMALDPSDLKCQQYLEAFSCVRHKKICFYSGLTTNLNVVYLKRFELYCHSGARMDTINYYDYVRNTSELSKGIDLLKLFNGEKSFLREKI